MIYAYHIEFDVSFDWMFGKTDERNPYRGSSATATGEKGVAIGKIDTVHSVTGNVSAQSATDVESRLAKLEREFAKIKKSKPKEAK